MNTLTNTEDRIFTLARFLGVDSRDIFQSKYDEFIFEVGSEEYLVLTPEEAEERAFMEIESMLWAFNLEFIRGYMPKMNDQAVKCLEEMRSKLCESSNDLFLALVGDNLNRLSKDAISAEGIGHFLSYYDGEEIDLDEFVAFRLN